ncbi:hypothetical protein ACA910_020173 [Epithemia clementina (nom. ined.)]
MATLLAKRTTSPSESSPWNLRPKLRQSIVDELESRVEKAKRDGRLPESIDTTTMAHRLERTLYAATKAAATSCSSSSLSPSSRDELDEIDLDSRLQQLCSTLANKRRRKSKRSATTTSEAIVQKQGQEGNYLQAWKSYKREEQDYRRKMNMLAHQARVLKYSWGEQPCCSCFQKSPLTLDDESKSSLPDPVKQFYFGTKLLQNPSMLQEEEAQEGPQSNPDSRKRAWEEAIAQAETNMAAFQAWAEVHLFPRACVPP